MKTPRWTTAPLARQEPRWRPSAPRGCRTPHAPRSFENSRRLLEAQARQEHEELVRESAGREWRDAGNVTLSGPSY